MRRTQCLVFFLVFLFDGSPRGYAADFDHSHSQLTPVLKNHLHGELVDYAALKENPKDLETYLDDLAGVSGNEFDQWYQHQQLAYLINLYNAQTLKLIIDHYPVQSIKDIGNVILGPWDKEVVRLFGQKKSLNYLEHAIIRKKYEEPRIHFALVCAALGCPPLRSEPYIPERLGLQLDDQAKQFFANPEKNRVDVEGKKIYLSAIFKWFKGDFLKQADDLTSYVSAYFPPGMTQQIQSGNFRIKYTEYDWYLNETKK